MTFEWLDEEMDINEIRDYIDEKRYKLYHGKDIIIADPLDEEIRKRIRHVVKNNYNDISIFSVGKGHSKKTIFRRKVIYEYIEVGKILHDASMAFFAGDYDESLDKLLFVFDRLTRPDEFIYRMIGNVYYKKGDFAKAADYYTVEGLLCLEKGTEFKSENKLTIINGQASAEVANVNDEDTYNIFDYEKSRFDDVNDLVLLTGLDVESACYQLGLTREMTNSVKLLYAREFFFKGMVDKGEEFLKSYERSSNKSADNKKMYREIINNKKLYQRKGNSEGEDRKVFYKTKP